MTVAFAEHDMATRSLRALDRSLTTSSIGAMEESGSRPVLYHYSTSPSLPRGYKLVIVEEALATAAISVGMERGWVIGRFQEPSRPLALAVAEAQRARADRAPEAEQAFDTAGDIAWLRSNLEIGMSDIASLFGVTRKAVYDWMHGAKATNASHIRAVKSLIEQELGAELRPYLRMFWEFDEAGGLPLLDLFKSLDARKLEEVRDALRSLSQPIANYVETIRSSFDKATVSHHHNHDEYRNL